MKKFKIYAANLALGSFRRSIGSNVVRRPRVLAPLLAIVLISIANISVFAQNPPFADGAFCSARTNDFRMNVQGLVRILSTPQFTMAAANSVVFAIGAAAPGFSYGWRKTGMLVQVEPGVSLDSGLVALREALGSSAPPGPFTANMTNATNMGTGGTLAVETMTLNLNAFGSETAGLAPRGLTFLSLTNMQNRSLGGMALTPQQAGALNGQAVLQVLGAANVALGGGPIPYPVTFVQLRELVETLNESFFQAYTDAAGVSQPCGRASAFAQTNLYQPYIASNAFTGRRPTGYAVDTLAPKAPIFMFSGEVVNVGRGCPAAGATPEDPYVANPAGKIALIERGVCTFAAKAARAQVAGATAVIVYQNAANGEALVAMGGTNPVALPGGMVTINIPMISVQRSTGLALIGGMAPVIGTVRQ